MSKAILGSKTCSWLLEVIYSSSANVTQGKLTLFSYISGFWFSSFVLYTKWECLDEMDKKSKEIKQNILAGYIKLTYTTSMFFLCQQNYWRNLLASTNISMTCQRNKKTELVDEMLRVYVHIQKEIIEMQKTCWSGWVCQAHITSASFPFLDLCYPQLAKIYHQTAMNIN